MSASGIGSRVVVLDPGETRPDAILTAGPNGAGKTSFSRQMLPVSYPDVAFLNADEIRHEGSEFIHSYAAGRELLRRLATFEETLQSFAIETTLSSRLYARRVPFWKSSGYLVHLHFIELPSTDFAVERVAARVAAGGHSVPEADIRRRFHRGLALFHEVYKPLVDRWYHWTNGSGGLALVDSEEKQ